MNLTNLINKNKTKQDKNGIWITDLNLNEEGKIAKNTWEHIHNFDLKALRHQNQAFRKGKLQDHLDYILKSYSFNKHTVYLEIGCGPAYVGEFLMEKYNCTFIGVDFNYSGLITLKKYFDEKGYKNYVLICADIQDMPLKNNSVDFIYGGGVIEHLRDTKKILKELYRVLKTSGVSFNTVPAFNAFWLTRFFYSIPATFFLRSIFEFIHLNILRGFLLNKFYGYELSFTRNKLKNLHIASGFKQVSVDSFAFHPSSEKLRIKFLRDIYYFLSNFPLFSPMYYVEGRK